MLVTDYPDTDLIDNLQYNIDHSEILESKDVICAKGYLWGDSADELLENASGAMMGYDVVILADLLFNHSEHVKLLGTVQKTLSRSDESRALVFFTPYRPWLLEKDLNFLTLAAAGGFTVTKILQTVMDKVMFEDDPGVSLHEIGPTRQ